MAARVHRIGSIYSRLDGLIRKGHVKEGDRPIWFDIYKNFPPKYEPTFKRKVSDRQIRQIFYKEDALRAKIHEAWQNRLGFIDLSNDKELLCETLLKTCQHYISEGLSEEEAIKKLKDFVKDPPKELIKMDEEANIEVQKILNEVL